MWIKKCNDDSETCNWISANTKECPKCGATIEKDGGCNHMICKNLSCKYDFCWVCLGPWEPHGSSWYNCNRYDEDAAKLAREGQQKSREVLERYLFYCNRYMNHLQSMKLENKLYAMVKVFLIYIKRVFFYFFNRSFLFHRIRWRKCNSTIWAGLRFNSFRRLLISCANVAVPLCTLTCSHTIWRKTINLLFLR